MKDEIAEILRHTPRPLSAREIGSQLPGRPRQEIEQMLEHMVACQATMCSGTGKHGDVYRYSTYVARSKWQYYAKGVKVYTPEYGAWTVVPAAPAHNVCVCIPGTSVVVHIPLPSGLQYARLSAHKRTSGKVDIDCFWCHPLSRWTEWPGLSLPRTRNRMTNHIYWLAVCGTLTAASMKWYGTTIVCIIIAYITYRDYKYKQEQK